MIDDAPTFRAYSEIDRDRCLEVFDANCPASFAPNERAEYVAFLQSVPEGYEVCLVDGRVAGAYGLIPTSRSDEPRRLRLNWIMIDPAVQGRGVGRAMMERVGERARIVRERAGAGDDETPLEIDIAASHVSAPFFARFGAVESSRVENGWGAGMHRVDMVLRV